MRNLARENGFGKEVEIDCCFAMISGVGFLVETTDDAFSMKNAIKVQHPNLEKILLSVVPALAGSNFSYLCEASIVGFFQESDDEKFIGEIVGLKKLNLVVSGLVFTIFDFIFCVCF